MVVVFTFNCVNVDDMKNTPNVTGIPVMSSAVPLLGFETSTLQF